MKNDLDFGKLFKEIEKKEYNDYIYTKFLKDNIVLAKSPYAKKKLRNFLENLLLIYMLLKKRFFLSAYEVAAESIQNISEKTLLSFCEKNCFA